MTENIEKPKPTEFRVRVSNPQTYELPLPTGNGKLRPGETVERTVTDQKLRMYTGYRDFEVEIVGDNGDLIAAAAKARESRAAEARNRLDALRKTLEERRAEERELESRLAALEDEERQAEAQDLAALREAGRNPQATATAVPTSAGSRTQEIQALRFDLWGAECRRLEAEAVHGDALAVVAADDTRRHQAKIKEAEASVEKAKDHLAAVRRAREGVEDREIEAQRKAQQARRFLAELEESGPQRVV